MKTFVDTWGWIVLKDPNEAQHRDAVNCFNQFKDLPEGIVTSDYVLDETFTLIFSRRPFEEAWQFVDGVLSAAATGRLNIERVGDQRFHKALLLRKRYADKPQISFTDLTSMVIMQDLRIQQVLTGDDHFRQAGLGFQLLP